MNRIRKSVAVMLVAVIIYSILGSLLTGVFAAETPVNIIIDEYDSGTLKFHWSQLTGARAAVIAYHTPNSDNTAALVTPAPVLTVNSSTISGLKSDYIYDISVTIYGAVDASNNPIGDPIGRGLLFYIPKMTFYSTATNQPYTDIPGGGREIGGIPKLKISWKAPRMFYDPDNTVYPETDPNPGNNMFTGANRPEALAYMQNSLRKIYYDDREISTINYRINISTELNLLNSGSSQAAVMVDQTNATTFHARVSGDLTKSALVSAPDSLEYQSFELWGRADEDSAVPTSTNTNVLPDNDLLPGTVYYMNIKPIYKNAAGTNVTAVTVGNPSDLNGSLLSGERAYTSTPIRFQLTKDSANNIYVKIYKINQGSLDLPRLFYEVQATDDPAIQGDWTVKKTMDDSYFSGTSAVTVISGVNPNNEVYYKIVVKSDSPEDRLDSLAMPYTLTVDTSRPPLPTGIAVTDRTLDLEQVMLPTGSEITVKSTDVILSWDKPLNWDAIKGDLYYHFLLSTSQVEITKDIPLYVDGNYWGSYPAEYRLTNYISAASSKIRAVGNRLEYTISAFDLFTWEGDIPADGGTIPRDGDYPTFLLPNTVYYLQMYTTKEADRGTDDTDKMSDRSIVASFTTLDGVELDVPLPMGFALDKNDKDTTADPALNYIEVVFDKVLNLDWNNYTDNYDETMNNYNVYYDIYMNSRTDTPFTLIGTTENLQGDVGFIGADDLQSTSVRARISLFSSQAPVNLFSGKLLPNTTYYFKVRTRLVIQNKIDAADRTTKESIDTAILPVTTIVLDITPPDDSLRKPLAPIDFSIEEGRDGNQLLSGSSVTFSWERQEEDVKYQLIRTSQKVGPTDLPPFYMSDPEYISFLRDYDLLIDGVQDGAVYFDPERFIQDQMRFGRYSYDSATNMCYLTVDNGMFPNKLYYFSLKAVRVNASRELLTPSSESVWVSIPVTTSLIDAPLSLEVVSGAELGFYWTDFSLGLSPEDYKIYVKGPADANYKLMTRSQATIVRDWSGVTYYGRVKGLKINTAYDIRVTKGINTPVYEKVGMETRDGYHEIEVMWIGSHLDNYSRYDIAIMEEGGSEYTVLSAGDLEQYVDKSGSVLPYYVEETARTVNNTDVYYHARVKSLDVVLPGGIATKQVLRSNVKYYIKVRAVKVDPTEPDLISYSKYIGPVNTRTEFNQEDYDNTDREEQQKAVFLDRMKDLEKGFFWRVAIGSNQTTSILLKGDRVSDAMKNSSGDSFTVDLTPFSVNIEKDEIYVPISVLRTMNALDRSLLLKTSGTELLLRPATLDTSVNEQVREVLERQEVKDLYVKLVVVRTSETGVPLPANQQRVSVINELDMQAMGLSRTDKDMSQMFHDKLYDEDSGLVSEKLNMLLNTYVGGGTGSADLIGKYTQSLVDMIEKELSTYIDSTIKSFKLSTTVRDITIFGTPISASVTFNNSKGVKIPYTLYDGSDSWHKVTANTVQSGSSVRFNLIKTGRFVVLTAQSSIGDVPAGHWAESYITSLASKYDLGGVFPGIQNSFMPDNKATCKEVVLLYEMVIGKTAENTGLNIRQKNEKLGLDKFLHPNSLVKNVKRQETAAVLLQLFSVKKGVKPASLKPGGRVTILDESSIGDLYFQPVLLMLDMKVLETEDGRFYPENQMTRAEIVTTFVKLLELTGDM